MIARAHGPSHLAAGFSDPQLIAAVERMEYISGFVTVVGPPDDPRPTVFNRYDHVSRVAWVAERLTDQTDTDPRAVSRLVWTHDINRWPFAHNAEQGRYDQAEHAFGAFGEFAELAEPEVADLVAFHAKQLGALTDVGAIALVADMVAGMIEDPLLLAAGLNLDPGSFPKVVADATGVDYRSEPIVGALREAATHLHRERSVEAFSAAFKELFEWCFMSFAETVNLGRAAIEPRILFQECYQRASAVKVEFLRPVVFPINNEHVCHGTRIRAHLVEPLIAERGFEAAAKWMLAQDERTVVAKVRTVAPTINLGEDEFYPDLDFIAREMPDRALLRLERK